MYILSSEQIASTVSGLKAGQCAAPAQATYDTLLASVLTRVEGACDVRSLSRKTWVDYFNVPEEMDGLTVCLRLSNGFVQEDAGILIYSEADGALTASHVIDREMGLVFVTLSSGMHRITYSSGFAADGSTGVFIDHPEWLQSIAKMIVVQWARLTSSSNIPENISYGALTAAMIREIGVRVYQQYMRPRANVLWSYRTAREIDPLSVTLPAAEE